MALRLVVDNTNIVPLQRPQDATTAAVHALITTDAVIRRPVHGGWRVTIGARFATRSEQATLDAATRAGSIAWRPTGGRDQIATIAAPSGDGAA